MMIWMQKLPSWDIITSKPSLWVKILSDESLNMAQLPRDIGSMNGWFYNLRTALESLSLSILVLISSLYLIILARMIEEDKMG